MDFRNSRMVCAVFLSAATFCLSCDDAGDLKGGLAGTWKVTRTLVTEVEGLPNGYWDEQVWTFAVQGESATLSTEAGSVGGTFNGTWVFQTEYYDPRTGMPASIRIEIIGVDPLRGTLENTVYDPTGYRPPSTEAFELEGVRI